MGGQPMTRGGTLVTNWGGIPISNFRISNSAGVVCLDMTERQVGIGEKLSAAWTATRSSLVCSVTLEWKLLVRKRN